MKTTDSGIYLRGDGRWEARYRKGRSHDGKIQYGSVYGSTSLEAKKKRAEILTELSRADVSPDEETESKLTYINPDIRNIYHSKKPPRSAQTREPLPDAAITSLCSAVEQCESCIRLGLMLSLYMGLSWGEVCALKYTDFSEDFQTLSVTRVMFDSKNMPGVITSCIRRDIPIPNIVRQIIPVGEHVRDTVYILTGTKEPVKSVRTAMNSCNRALEESGFTQKIYPESLRLTFIRKALEYGANYETVSELVGIDKSSLARKYGRYVRAVPELIDSIVKEMSSRIRLKETSRQMNLLILGAGSQGLVVKDIAEELGIFTRIDYLDDNPENKLAVDTCEHYLKYIDTHPVAIPSFGDCKLRAMWSDRLSEAGFILPKLIHPSVTLLGNIEIGDGVVIEAKAIVSSGVKIGRNCIISAGSVLDKGAVIGANTHIGCACTVTKGSSVAEFTRVRAGTIYSSDETNATSYDYKFENGV